MTTETKRKLTLWGGGIALAALFFGGSVRDTVERAMMMRHARHAPPPSRAKTAAPKRNAAPPGAAPGTQAAPAPSYDKLVGVWEGFGPAAPNMCTLRLELRRKDGDAAHLAGFPVLTCFPMAAPTAADMRAPQKMLSRFSPMSAVLSGSPVNGSIEFTVDKVIGKSAEGCAITSFTVTPFGADQISAGWKDAPCQGGQLLLKKGRG